MAVINGSIPRGAKNLIIAMCSVTVGLIVGLVVGSGSSRERADECESDLATAQAAVDARDIELAASAKKLTESAEQYSSASANLAARIQQEKDDHKATRVRHFEEMEDLKRQLRERSEELAKATEPKVILPLKDKAEKKAAINMPSGLDASPAMQQERLEFVNKMIAEGYWERLTLGEHPKVWINESFLLLTKKMRNQFLSVAFAYCVGEGVYDSKDTVFWYLGIKLDNGTQLGRRMGSYNPTDGWTQGWFD